MSFFRLSFQIAEKTLELFVGVEDTGAQGSLRDVEEFGYLLVGEPHNVAERHDFPVGRRELVEGLTETFLDVCDVSATHGVGIQSLVGKLTVFFEGCAVFIIIDAEGIFSFAFAQEVAGLVGCNRVEPGVKGAERKARRKAS